MRIISLFVREGNLCFQGSLEYRLPRPRGMLLISFCMIGSRTSCRWYIYSFDDLNNILKIAYIDYSVIYFLIIYMLKYYRIIVNHSFTAGWRRG
jgi:hypothetical protein